MCQAIWCCALFHCLPSRCFLQASRNVLTARSSQIRIQLKDKPGDRYHSERGILGHDNSVLWSWHDPDCLANSTVIRRGCVFDLIAVRRSNQNVNARGVSLSFETTLLAVCTTWYGLCESLPPWEKKQNKTKSSISSSTVQS